MKATDNLVVGKVEAIIRHYFDPNVDTLFDDSNSLAYLGLWALAISWVLAFFTMGVTNSEGEPIVSMTFFVIGFVAFIWNALLHSLMVVLGSFYKYGVFKSVGFALIVVLGVIAYAIAFIVGTMGGFFISITVGMVLPSFGVLAPFKIILLAIPTIWWFAKGWQLTVEFKSLRQTFDLEIQWLSKHGFEI